MSVATGYFASEEKKRRTARTHVVEGGRPICGANIGPTMRFQYCAGGVYEPYVSCNRCRRIAERRRMPTRKVT